MSRRSRSGRLWPVSSARRVVVLATVGAALGLAALAVFGLRRPHVPEPGLGGTLREGGLEVDGRTRTFGVYLPAELPPAPGLLLVLHGSTMDGAAMRRAMAFAFDVLADREGLVVAYPDGWGGHFNDCRAVGRYRAKRERIDDVAFMEALIEHLAREHGVDRGRVFAAGYSNGAQLAYRLALEAPGLVRGIAAIAASLPAPANQSCSPAGRPVATLIINGTADPLNPYGGGDAALFGLLFRRGAVLSTRETARYWADLAGHAGAPSAERLTDIEPGDGATAVREVWSSAGGPAVSLITVEGGGHTMPGPRATLPRLFGRTCRDFTTAEEVWHFFARAMDETEAGARPSASTARRRASAEREG